MSFSVDESVYCNKCNTVFSSKVLLYEHTVCCSSSYGLIRVKTEIDDSEQVVQGPAETPAAEPFPNNTQVNVANIKTEVKSEVLDASEVTHSHSTFKNVPCAEFAVSNKGNGNAPVIRVRGRRGTVLGSRGRGGHITRTEGIGQHLPQVPSTSHKTPGPNGCSRPQLRFLPNILPKIACSSKSGDRLKIDSVFYTQLDRKKMNVVKMVNYPKNNCVSSFGAGVSIHPTSTEAKTAVDLPKSFTLNTVAGTGGMPALTSFMLSNNILSNAQQDRLILTGSAPLLTPLPHVNAVQATGLFSGLPTMSHSLPNYQNVNIPPNQNTALGVQQSIPQVFNPGSHSNAVFTSDTVQAVGSIMASAIAPSQQVPYKVPVLVGNQIILMDMPVQYPNGISLASTSPSINLPPLIQSSCLASTSTSLSLPPFIQSPHLSSTITPTAVTQMSAVNTGSTKQPSNSVSVSSIHSKSALKTTQCNIAPKQMKSQQGLHPQTETILLSSNVKKKLCSKKNIPEAKTYSSSTKLAETQNADNQMVPAQAEKPNDVPLMLNKLKLNDRELTNERSEISKNLDEKIETPVDQKTGAQFHFKETVKHNGLLSNSVITALTADTVPSVITSSAQEPVMSTGANSSNLISASGPLLNTSSINILPHSSVPTMMHQPPVLLSQFPTNEQLLRGPISVVNNNTINIGGTPGLYFSNALSLPSPNFTMLKNSGTNVWIQNITNSQHIVNDSNNSQQSLFLNIPASDPFVKTHNISSVTTTSTCTLVSTEAQKTSSTGHKSIKVSGFPLPFSKRKRKRMMSITMETPDTMGKRRTLLSDKGENLHLEVSSNSSESIFSQGFAECQREPKTVKEMLKTKVIIKQLKDDDKNKESSSSVQYLDHKTGTIVAQNTKKLPRFRKLKPFQQICGKKSGPIINLLRTGKKTSLTQPSTTYFDTKSRLLNIRCGTSVSQCDKKLANTSTGSSGILQPNDGAICKISEVKSIADLTPQFDPLNAFVDANNLKDDMCPVGTLFVGPLTKEQVDKIIQDPSEVGKYVSVPSGHILSSKAFVVPAGSTTCTVSNSTAVPHGIPAFSPVASHIVFDQPSFIKIQPKPVVQMVQSPFNSVNINTRLSTVAYLPPSSSSVSMTSTILSDVPNPTIESAKRLGTHTEKTVKNDTKTHEIETSNKAHDTALRMLKVKKFLSEKRKKTLQCKKTENSQKNDNMKLSFVGDLQLLKECLRRSTVSLEMLDTTSEAINAPISHYNNQIKHTHAISETDLSKSGKDEDYKPKLEKRNWHDQPKIVRTRRKEQEFSLPGQKHWVPVEVVGDLAIRGKLLESKQMGDETSERGGKRRSNRISAKPRLDYADLEKSPFNDLEEDLVESDLGLDLSSNSPPLLSPVEKLVEKEDIDDNVIYIDSPPETIDVKPESTNDFSALSTQSGRLSECVSQMKEEFYYSSESESDMFDSSDQSLTKADKKKMMWKRHSEITMFLVKHADKFHSDDDKNEHYCSVCCKYKTNGIFRLSNHIKRHLSDILRCSRCAYQACHEQDLICHGQTHH